MALAVGVLTQAVQEGLVTPHLQTRHRVTMAARDQAQMLLVVLAAAGARVQRVARVLAPRVVRAVTVRHRLFLAAL